MKEDGKKRIQWIDVAKGIGILLVVFQHCLTATNMMQTNVSLSILSFHMPLFFFLSGYVYRQKDNTLFFADRVKGLILPVILYKFVNIVIGCIVNFVGRSDLYSAFCFAGFWFLEALFFISVIYYVFDNSILNRGKKYNEYLHLMFGGVLFICGLYYSKQVVGREIAIVTALVGYLFFALGKYVRVCSNKDDCKNRFKKFPGIFKFMIGIVFIILTFLFAQSNTPVQMYMNDYGNSILFLVNALIGIVGICFISMYIHDNCVLEFYGKNSLVILLTHFPLFRVLPGLIGHIIENKIVQCMLSFLVVCIIEYFVIMVINKFFPFMAGKIKYDDRM